MMNGNCVNKAFRQMLGYELDIGCWPTYDFIIKVAYYQGLVHLKNPVARKCILLIQLNDSNGGHAIFCNNGIRYVEERLHKMAQANKWESYKVVGVLA